MWVHKKTTLKNEILISKRFCKKSPLKLIKGIGIVEEDE